MKNIILLLLCTVVLAGFIGCNHESNPRDDDQENKNTEDENSIDEGKTDIHQLFTDTEELDSVSTMRIDITYTLENKEQIDALIKLLEAVEYKAYDPEETKEDIAKGGEPTGSSSSGIFLVFNYQDGSKRSLEFTSQGEEDLVKYSEISYEPYQVNEVNYSMEEDIWYDVLWLMEKGERKDLNKK